MVLHLSNDLMLVGKVSAWAKSQSIPYRNISNLSKLATSLAEDSVDVVLVDLQLRNLDIEVACRTIKQADVETRVYGYAQHVMTDMIEAARAVGYDAVLTRGQFDRGFADLMQKDPID